MPQSLLLSRQEMIALERQILRGQCVHGNRSDTDMRYRDSRYARKALEKIRALAPKGRTVRL